MSELALIATDPGAIERAADPGAFIVMACERAKAWLVEVLEHGDIDQIVELKSQAEAIRVYTAQKQIGTDAELAAAEVVRRAERGLVQVVRRGQERGEIRRRGQSFPHTGRVGDEGPQRVGEAVNPANPAKGRSDFEELAPLADASDADFDNAIAEAKAEGNLSRANVKRKATKRDDARSKLPAATRLEGKVIEGIGVLCQRYNGELDDERAVKQWGNAHGGVNGLLNKAAATKAAMGKPLSECIASAATDIYNAGGGGRGRLPKWWKS